MARADKTTFRLGDNLVGKDDERGEALTREKARKKKVGLMQRTRTATGIETGTRDRTAD
jgi:hypothetical protein